MATSSTYFQLFLSYFFILLLIINFVPYCYISFNFSFSILFFHLSMSLNLNVTIPYIFLFILFLFFLSPSSYYKCVILSYFPTKKKKIYYYSLSLSHFFFLLFWVDFLIFVSILYVDEFFYSLDLFFRLMQLVLCF